MRECGMYAGPVYHILSGPDMSEIKVCGSYPEYLAYYMDLKKHGKGTRYVIAEFDRKVRLYHYYLRVVDE